jgi:YVTN family beta-propeller protein
MMHRKLALGTFCLGLLAAVTACSSDHDSMAGHENAVHGALPTTTPLPAAITFDALFVVNGSENSISVINTETNELAGKITLQNASYPHHLYLSADRSKMLLAVPGMDLSGGHEGHAGMAMPGSVLLLDATTGSTIKSRTLDAMNHNAAFAPGGAEVWTSQMVDAGKVLVLDTATLETKQTIAVGSRPAEVTFAPDGKYAFVANSGSDDVTVIDVATKQTVKTVPVGDNPVGAWQGANGVAYVDNEMGKSLTAIDTKTLDVTLTFDLGFTPAMAATPPDAQSLWVTDVDGGRVVIHMPDSNMTMGEVATGAGAHAIAFAGDGKTAYISNQTAGTVSVIDVAAKKVTKTITVGTKPNGMAWRAK